MERIGIYGGTFNPPHIGHMRAAECAIRALKLDKLLMIPTGMSPHKQVAAGATAQQRFEMLRLSAAGMAKTEVSDLELKREGKSYTVDTVKQVREEYPNAELFLLMGTDMFTSFHTWYRPEEIARHVTLAVFCRGEKKEREQIAAQKEILEARGVKIVLVDNPVTAISSTDLRRMLVFRCANPFLREGVADYIRVNGLYDTGKDFTGLSVEQLEQEVVALLNPNRVAHVLGCRDSAVELAKHYGEDVTDAARAGLLHDITKAIDGPLQLTLCAEYGIVLDKFSQENPKTLHALTGSLVADAVFGENENVVRAIRHHTTGRADMTLLEKIIYIADYIEVNRDFPGVDKLREAAFRDLDEALLRGFETTIAHVRRQGQELSMATVEAAQFLRSRGVCLTEDL